MLACQRLYTPLTDFNINTAVELWVSDQVSDQALAASTYGDLNQWDVATVTDMLLSKSILLILENSFDET